MKSEGTGDVIMDKWLRYRAGRRLPMYDTWPSFDRLEEAKEVPQSPGHTLAELIDAHAKSQNYPPWQDAKRTELTGMHIYVAGPMRGIEAFNFPAFDAATAQLRTYGHIVCNPAEKDREEHGDEVANSATGDLADIAHTGFDIRKALAFNMAWIAGNADAVAVLPGWERSSGARAEVALAHALGLVVAPWDAYDATREPWRIIEAPHPPSALAVTGEVRTTSTTGGEKGVKPERLDLVPVGPLLVLARHFAVGAEKYADHNWRLGYEWSKSYAALLRHLLAFWSGEEVDEETGSPHLAGVGFHWAALMEFSTRPEYAQFDDRYKGAT